MVDEPRVLGRVIVSDALRGELVCKGAESEAESVAEGILKIVGALAFGTWMDAFEP
jgi:hypothetical protein